ncbi:MAG: acyl carrier protein [Hyphomicrobium sp.]|jgi:acyl carrier protein|nr:acyl carrier protein [Hyphomicrobium sp.]
MQDTFNTVAEIISSTGDVPVDDIKPESHVMKDLGVDSLAFLDIAFEIDQKFNIKLPIDDWMQTVNDGKAKSEEFFLVGNLCRNIDQLVAHAAVA